MGMYKRDAAYDPTHLLAFSAAVNLNTGLLATGSESSLWLSSTF